MPSLLLANDAQEVQRARMACVGGEDDPIARFSLCQAAVLVKPHSFVKRRYGSSWRRTNHFHKSASILVITPTLDYVFLGPVVCFVRRGAAVAIFAAFGSCTAPLYPRVLGFSR